ncbi:MAG: PAS domain-containing protein [Bacillota bacterium]|nr:PAS domain-containing protein [Bacillota bacterium]
MDYVSPQTKRMLGYEPEEWTGFNFWVEKIHLEDRNWARNYCLTATREGKEHIFEYRFRKKAGGYIWIRDEVVVIM